MYNLSKKQKVILGVLVSIVLFSIWYYVYAKEEQEILLSQDSLKVQENVEEKDTEENLTEGITENIAEDEVINSEVIVVDVSGAVNQPGIVELPFDSRVADAIEKAGGVTVDADTKSLNLASKLEDGMKVHVYSKQDNVNEVIVSNNVTSQYNANYNTNTSSVKTQKVNINTALQTELETLPGIGPSTALKIINYRNENGNFKSIEEIKEVSGIGESKYNQIKELISIN